MHNNNNNDNDNQFLLINLQQSNLNMKSRSLSHEALIDKLQQKNNTLKKQVYKIQKALSNMKIQQKPKYGLILPEIKPDALKKQLSNAYKQIKIYQYEVQKKNNQISSQSAYLEQQFYNYFTKNFRINKIQKVYKQKVQIHERLKRQFIQIKHESKQLTKNLKNNLKKQRYQNKQLTLSTDVKYLNQQLRQYEQRRIQHISQLQKQRNVIKQLEKQILQQNSIQFLQNIKLKIFKPQQSISSVSRAIVEIQNIQSNNMTQNNQQSRLTTVKNFNAIEQQSKKYQSIETIKNDIKLFKKMHIDYQIKINFINKEKDQAIEKNFKSRNKLLEVEFEIQNIQKSILQLKKLIDPKMLKPIHIKPVQKKKQPIKKKGPSILHSYKHVQIGQITKNGKRFTDRQIIGKKNTKITAVTLYQKVQTLQFVGIQVSYLIQGQKPIIKKGNLNMSLDPKKQQLKQQNIQLLQGDYFKTIDLFIKKSKITGISMNSLKNKIIKIGQIDGERNVLEMKQSEYPMCIYGSLLKNGLECFGVEIYTVQDDKNHYGQEQQK